MNPAGEPYGEAHLLAAVDRGRSEPLATAVAALQGEVEQWCGAAGRHDDMSIVAAEMSAAGGDRD